MSPYMTNSSTTDADANDATEYADRRSFRDVAAEMESWLGDDATGHDMDHAWRVFDLGTEIAEAEGADREIVGAAALTHDVHRAMDGNETVHPTKSLSEVRGVLERAAFPDEKISAVLHCVEVHDEYDYRGVEYPAESLEAEILQDADNLDAIGAVGIARNFAFTGAYGNPLWDPEGDEPSGISHCYDKLLKLKDEMNTATARELAAERHDFLAEFVERFEREWEGY